MAPAIRSGYSIRSTTCFFAATYYSGGDSYVYEYDRTAGTWNTDELETQAGVHIINAYGGQVHNGQLYISGLAEPWSGGYGQDNYIFAFDHAAIPDGDSPRHDTLIQTSGNSAHMAVAPNGDVYYGTYSDNTLYRWTSSQVASVFNDLHADEEDTFLTLGRLLSKAGPCPVAATAWPWTKAATSFSRSMIGRGIISWR